MPKPQSSLDEAFVLDAQLNRAFGPTFAEVLNYETKRELGSNLYEALRDNPAGAISVLKRIFRSGDAVGVILHDVRTRLSESRTEHERRMVSLFDQAMPLVTGVAD